MIFLDAAATTPVRPEALQAAWPHLTGLSGNPSSVHEPGLAAAGALAAARAGVARFLGCRPGEVVFTSGGTEGANVAIKGLALANPRGRQVVTSRLEHEAVLQSADYLRRVHGFAVDYVEPDADGLVDPAALRRALRSDTTLVTIGFANNEVGTVQDIGALAAVAHGVGALFHTDAVQAAPELPIDVAALGVDALSFSGHKLGAPQGSGAVFVRGRLALEPLLHGGGQERGRRSGTENVAWAVALQTACALTAGEFAAQARRADAIPVGAASRDGFIAAVLAAVPGAALTGHPSRRLARHASFVVPGVNGETVLLELERRGVIASSGSACAAGSTEPSHVLTALGYDEDAARTALRFSWTADTGDRELALAADAVREAVAAVRGHSAQGLPR
ncbi:cysteine desulfurase family protein [Gryllotalpicola sp.]|uniref:cysteine desulfurase family protein n=1 Tax=Gryllotalpicola sp. TaxID=1932787 RepID=UPI002634678B|nr:cysteine desulfurase family protein [Gryllotalpicola sp.]